MTCKAAALGDGGSLSGACPETCWGGRPAVGAAIIAGGWGNIRGPGTGVSVHARVCASKRMYARACRCLCRCVWVHVCVCMCVCMFVRVHACVCVWTLRWCSVLKRRMCSRTYANVWAPCDPVFASQATRQIEGIPWRSEERSTTRPRRF
eukprot:GHVU01216769.1.p1 GENE.GHVU01216769.1~~GHVU01216769.1.p1  ORF type:complete len:150 (+),score=3.51 GHVU01216769.1:175-624(+)